MKHEAVFSSQIEGIQSTLEDVLEYEVNPGAESRPGMRRRSITKSGPSIAG